MDLPGRRCDASRGGMGPEESQPGEPGDPAGTIGAVGIGTSHHYPEILPCPPCEREAHLRAALGIAREPPLGLEEWALVAQARREWVARARLATWAAMQAAGG